MNHADSCEDRHGSSPESRSALGTRGYAGDAGVADGADATTVTIDCDSCTVRGPACRDCVVSVLLGPPPDLREDERAALDVLAKAGLAPRLRLAPAEPTAGRANPGAA